MCSWTHSSRFLPFPVTIPTKGTSAKVCERVGPRIGMSQKAPWRQIATPDRPGMETKVSQDFCRGSQGNRQTRMLSR